LHVTKKKKQGRERDIKSLLACKLLVEALQAELMLVFFWHIFFLHMLNAIVFVCGCFFQVIMI